MALTPEKELRLKQLRLQKLRAMKAAQPAVHEKLKDKWYEDLGQGIAEAGIGTYLGIKDLFGKASDAEKQSLEDLRSDARESGWGTAGRVVGEAAQLAVPGGAGLKAARALGGASKLAKALPVATDIAASAAHGAVTLPQEGDSRTGNALASGGSAVGGAMLGKALTTLGKGMKLKPEAERMRDLGIEVTPGQSIPFFKRAEDIAEVSPFFARATKKMKKASQETAHRAALKQAAAPGATVSKAGHEGVAELKKGYEAAYASAWGPVDNLDSSAVPRTLTVGSYGAKRLGKKDTNTIRRVQDDIIKLVTGDPNVSGKQLDEAIRKSLMNTKKSRDLDEVLTEMRQTLRSGLPRESQAALSAIDAQYPKYLAVKEAARTMGALGEKGHFDAQDLMTGIKAIGRGRESTGQAPLQAFADDVMATVGQRPGPQPLSWWRRMSDITPTIGPQKTMAKMITGQAKGQPTLRKALESEAARKLRYGITGARLGAALEEQE